ncbi:MULTISPECIES: TatD family hydrolase [Selenomonas]|uniref:TatD family hydrolase n=1 Tax=Selenomonas TaxID=970 RepID=UPI0016567AF5|nr:MULTISPECIES: TatD family hydrolase [unclassified Selenomonas]MBQ1867129.1 TatD family hydrolase [Selenomonas sp.]
MIELVDTHTHLNDAKFSGHEQEAIERARENGVTRLINMGDTLESSAKAVELAAAYEGVYAGVGIHPEEAFPMTSRDDDQLAAWTEEPRVVAIGEIGLDYYWEKDQEKRQLQQQVFIRQLDLARQLHLPVCVHDREAHGDTLSILKREGRGIRGVMHCFSGSFEMAQELLKLGWYIGVDGPLTFKNAAKLPEIVQKFPLERLLVETDAPYMAPVPMRGKQNEPAFVRFVAEKVAEIKGISLETVAKQTSQNAEELYGL